MSLRKLASTLLTLVGIAAFAPQALAQSPLYATLNPPQPLEGGGKVEAQRGLTRVSMVGSGMHNTPGVYARSFKALHAAGIEVYAIGSSAITITFLVDSKNEEKTVQVLHEAFDFGNG